MTAHRGAVLLVLLLCSAASAFGAAGCRPADITDSDDAGCGRWFPRFHPKNAAPLAHNNDANAPFYYNGVYHIFMQAMFPGVPGWNGAIGLGHLASRDLASWKELPPALVPGAWGGPPGRVGEPAGNTTGGYYSGSATLVGGVPRIVVPAVWGSDHPDGPGTGPGGAGNCDWLKMKGSACFMVYVQTKPVNLSDPWLTEWSEPITIIDGRVDGVQPIGPGFDDVTHAWQDRDHHPGDEQEQGEAPWLFAGQSTTAEYPEYLQLWRSKNGSDWTAGFESLGNFLPKPNLHHIANVPDFWRATETNLGADFLHFGDNAYFLGNYTKTGDGFGETVFVPLTPAQSFGATGEESHGFFDDRKTNHDHDDNNDDEAEEGGRFVWFGCVNSPVVPAEAVRRNTEKSSSLHYFLILKTGAPFLRQDRLGTNQT